MDNGRIMVLGIGFDNVDKKEAVDRALALAEKGGGMYVATPNAEIVYTCQKDEKAKRAVNGADLVIPDGSGVVKASKILKRPLKARVPGVELGEAILAGAVERGFRLFIYGGKPGVAEKAAERLTAGHPGLNVCGTLNGFQKDNEAVISVINAAKADILIVCLGAPRQEIWMQENRGRLDVRLMLGLGGSIDIYAGEVARAPKFISDSGFEWLYRMIKQPKRIKRVMTGLPPFLMAVHKERSREKRSEKDGKAGRA